MPWWQRCRRVASRGLAERAIGSGVHYRGVHLHEYYRERYGLAPEALPVTADMSERTISLPLGAGVSEGDVERVCAALRAVVATRVGGLADLGPGAVLVPPADPSALRAAVARLLGDERLRTELGAQARERTLSHGAAAAILVDLYCDAIR